MALGNLTLRIATAVVALPLLLSLLFLAPWWGWLGLVAVAALLASVELFRMTHPGDAVAQWILASLSAGLCIWLSVGQGPWAAAGALAAVIVGIMLQLWRLGDVNTAALRVFAAIGGPLYLGGLLSTAVRLRLSEPHGARWVLLALLLAWMGDTMGYAVGRTVGGPKLYPAVSPKKTWSGFLGAVLGSTAAAVAMALWALPELPVGTAVVLGATGGVLGQGGDLVESLVKRSTQIKDSGGLLPGHGGLWDRIDALLVTSTLTYFAYLFVS